MGITWAYPPPVAPPFTPNTGPSDGSLSVKILFLPNLRKASFKDIETVVLPSPIGVGFMAVTKTNLLFLFLSNKSKDILALLLPYNSILFSIPRVLATSVISLGFILLAISISVILSTSFFNIIILKHYI